MKRQCVFCLCDDGLEFPHLADRIERFLCGGDISRLGVCAYCDRAVYNEIGKEFFGVERVPVNMYRAEFREIREFRQSMSDELAQTFALGLLAKNVLWRSKIKGFCSAYDRNHGRRFVSPGGAP